MDMAETCIEGLILSHRYNDAFHYKIMQEFEMYESTAKSQRNFVTDVYGWWCSVDGFNFLNLVGKRFAAMHASSANTERIFSGLSRILTGSRNRLDTGTIFELLSIRVCTLSNRDKKKFTRPLPPPPPGSSQERASISSQMSVDIPEADCADKDDFIGPESERCIEDEEMMEEVSELNI